MKGIDGTANGWVSADYTGSGWRLEFHRSLESIRFERSLIDIPVGLPEKSTRACDRKARRFLSPERHYSVFNCPVRQAVYADSYTEASDINEELTGKRISRQAWNIVPKIREADTAARESELRESHPEVFFKSLSRESVEKSKNSDEGLNQRIDVLRNFGDVSVTEEFSQPGVTEDDLVDAMVLSLGSELDLETFQEDPETDNHGLEMSILKPSTG